MKHQKEWHTCDRCGKEINIPKEKKWYDCITSHLREMKLKKPLALESSKQTFVRTLFYRNRN